MLLYAYCIQLPPESALECLFPQRGNAVCFFILCFLCLDRCLLPFFGRFSLLRVAVWKNFRVRTFVFWGQCWFVFFGAVLLMFCFMFCRFTPESVWKNSLGVRSCFLGFVLSSLGFFVDVVFVFPFFLGFFKRQSSRSNRTPPHALVLFVLVLLFSRRAWFITRFGRASCFLAFFSGCHSGPRAFWGFSWNLRGLSSLAPSEAPSFWTRCGKGVSLLLALGFCFPLFVLFCGYTRFTRRPAP